MNELNDDGTINESAATVDWSVEDILAVEQEEDQGTWDDQNWSGEGDWNVDQVLWEDYGWEEGWDYTGNDSNISELSLSNLEEYHGEELEGHDACAADGCLDALTGS